MPSTITLQSVVDFNRTRTRMVQLVGVGGIPNQPALDICNDVLQTLLSSPNNWKFNKTELPSFTTIQNQQDYVVSGCQMSVTAANGTPRCIVHLNSVLSTVPGLTESGTTVTATFSDFAPNGILGLGSSSTSNIQVGDLATITGASQAGYNLTNAPITQSLTTSVQFTAAPGLTTDGGQGINNVSWFEHATLQDYFSGAVVKPVHDIEIVSSLPKESIIQPPFKVCNQVENILTGTIAGQSVTLVSMIMRFWPVPSSQIWRAFLFYQNRAPLKTALAQNWTPWPDDLGYVLRSGVYAKALDHAEDPRAPMADAKWQQDILKALDIRQQEQRHESFYPDLPLMRGG